MTETPDPGLTDLIAAHARRSQYIFEVGPRYRCTCGWAQDVKWGDDSPFPAHVALVVEQYTNGRITELGWGELVAAIPDGWELQESAQLEEVSRVRQRDLEASQVTTARWRARAEKAEATIARVITALEAAEKSVPDDWGVTYIYTSQLRAALEGEQQ